MLRSFNWSNKAPSLSNQNLATKQISGSGCYTRWPSYPTGSHLHGPAFNVPHCGWSIFPIEEEDEEQFLKLALEQPWVWSVGAFIVLATAYVRLTQRPAGAYLEESNYDKVLVFLDGIEICNSINVSCRWTSLLLQPCHKVVRQSAGRVFYGFAASQELDRRIAFHLVLFRQFRFRGGVHLGETNVRTFILQGLCSLGIFRSQGLAVATPRGICTINMPWLSIKNVSKQHKLIDHSMITSIVWTDDHKLTQESNLTARLPIMSYI